MEAPGRLFLHRCSPLLTSADAANLGAQLACPRTSSQPLFPALCPHCPCYFSVTVGILLWARCSPAFPGLKLPEDRSHLAHQQLTEHLSCSQETFVQWEASKSLPLLSTQIPNALICKGFPPLPTINFLNPQLSTL